MAYTNPSVTDFQNQFVRDFPYGTDPENNVLNSDITNAFNFTNFNINQALFQNQAQYPLGYLLLSAHYLVLNMRASSQGINGQYNFLEQSKGVGALNSSFAIPQRILDNPYWSMLTKTNYGSEYLQLLLPQLAGQMMNAFGTVLP